MNARFVNKALLKSDLNTLNALIAFYEDGREITVCPPGKRNLSKSPSSVNAVNAKLARKANSKKRG